MDQTLPQSDTAKYGNLDFTTLLPGAPFHERHTRSIDQPVETVWKALLNLTGDEIRLLQPLFKPRGLPAILTGKQSPQPTGDRPVLDLFADEGFVMLRKDERPRNGRATLIFGAAGRFWSPTHNTPVLFTSPQDFLAFDAPDHAKTVARFDVFASPVGTSTRIETETLVAGTDPASTRKFRPYWMLIRGPSGLLRRSWLAAVERRANT